MLQKGANISMKHFKSLDEVLGSDPRSASFGTVEFQHQRLAEIMLDSNVPPEVADFFVIVKNVC